MINRSLSIARASCLLALATAYTPAFAQTEPYSIYGGAIETDAKNAAIEACEYKELVEEQRCNRRTNKTTCIKEVHRQCREENGNTTTDDGKINEK